MGRILRRHWPVLLVVIAPAIVLVVHYLATHRRAQEESYPKDNYSLIEEGLYLGGTLSEPPTGVRAVLNVCETEDPYRAEVHRWEAIPDLGPAPNLAWLRSQVEFIDQQRQAGRPVFVHCRAGINRGPTVVAAYLMWRDRLTRDEALTLIRRQRARVFPFPVYMEFLTKWEKSILE